MGRKGASIHWQAMESEWPRQRGKIPKVQNYSPLLSVYFSDIEHLAGILQAAGFPLQLRQLEGGRCRGQLQRLQLGSLQLLQIQLNRSLVVIGDKAVERMLLCLSLAPLGPSAVGLQSHGHSLGEAALYGLDSQRPVHLVTPSCYSLAIASINRDLLFAQAEVLGAPDLAKLLGRSNVLSLHHGRLGELRRCITALFARPPIAPGPPPQNELIPLLIEAIVDGKEREQGIQRQPPRFDIVQMAERWALENPGTPISLDGLCRQVHASRRSLIQGFNEHLGMAPMRFIRLQRLHGVRRALLEAEPTDTSVAELSGTWGFRSSGHFSRNYQRLFGELPSQTLQRAPWGVR